MPFSYSVYHANACPADAFFPLLCVSFPENTVDISPFFVFFRLMNTPNRKLVTPASLAVDAVLVLGFFAFIFNLLRPHVQSHDPVNIAIWAGLASACLSSVFWLAIQMFRVVYRAQHASKK